MQNKEYVCICGKIFYKPNSFNAHKQHCKKHQIQKHGSLDFYINHKKNQANKSAITNRKNTKIKNIQKINAWISEQHKCEKCGKIMTEKFGSGKFCSRSCANTRIKSNESKQKLKNTLRLKGNNLVESNRHKHQELINIYNNEPKKCVVCGKTLAYAQRKHKTCGSKDCLFTVKHNNGYKSITKQGNSRRSKSEMYFYELCENYFKNVEHNIPMFDGWDADIIIHDIKYAVLWNGPLHYLDILGLDVLEKTQERDKLKVKHIKECGYEPYVIKQLGTYDKKFIEDQFQLFINHINYV